MKKHSKPTEHWNLKWKPAKFKPWFEWWFFKIVDKKSGEIFSIHYSIISKGDIENKKKQTPFAKISVIRFKTKQVFEHTFSISSNNVTSTKGILKFSDRLTVSKNSFAGEFHAEGSGSILKWNFEIIDCRSFQAMGLGRFFSPVLSANWTPHLSDMSVSGTIQIDKQRFNLIKQPAYGDRMWGQDLPKWWLWIHCNNFEKFKDSSIVAGGGLLNVANKFDAFSVLSMSVRHKGKEMIFRQSEGSDFQFNELSEKRIKLTAINLMNQKVELHVVTKPRSYISLEYCAPSGKRRDAAIKLKAQIWIFIYERSHLFSPWKLIEKLQSNYAACELGSYQHAKN